MIDCHIHLIPNMDDGSSSMEESIETLRQMAEGGITAVFCTSHYTRGLYNFSYIEYNAKFRELEAEVKHQNIPVTLYPGAEVHVTNDVAEDIKREKLTLADSNYVLIETELNGFPSDFKKNVFYLLRAGYRPILAHAERYVDVIKKAHEAKELINRSVYIQVSATSILGMYGEKVKQTAWKLLNTGWAHIMASDHHSKTHYDAFFKAKGKISEHIDDEMADILTRLHPQCIVNNNKIEYNYVWVQKVRKRRPITDLFRRIGF